MLPRFVTASPPCFAVYMLCDARGRSASPAGLRRPRRIRRRRWRRRNGQRRLSAAAMVQCRCPSQMLGMARR